jgi:integrase
VSVATFHDFAVDVLAQRAEEGIRGIKSEQNRFELHVGNASFAGMLITEIRSKHIREWLRDMARKDAADTRGTRKICVETIKRSFALVSAVFAAAVEQEIVETNPCIGVKAKKRADENSTRDKWAWLTLDEQKLIASCAAIPFMDRLMIRFAIGSGLRQGEQCNLELVDLHVGHDNPHVFVRYGSRGRLPPKNGKTRRVPLFGDSLIAAKEWLAELPAYAPSNPHGLVFPTVRGRHRGIGKPLGGGTKLKRYLAFVGITRRVRWHDLRHTFCSNLVSGVLGRRWSLEEIRPLAGHSSIGITERYSHIGEAELLKATAETGFSHGSLMPPVPAAPDTSREFAIPDAPDTARELETWFEEEAVAS